MQWLQIAINDSKPEGWGHHLLLRKPLGSNEPEDLAAFRCCAPTALSGIFNMLFFLFFISFSHYANSGVFSDAIRNGDKDQITRLISSGEDINDKNSPALSEALEHGNMDIILHLLNCGADPNRSLPHGFFSTRTPRIHFHPIIFYASTIQSIFALLVYGADPNQPVCNSRTLYTESIEYFPLHYLVFYYWLHLKKSIREDLISQRITNPQQLNIELFNSMPILTISALEALIMNSFAINMALIPRLLRKVVSPFGHNDDSVENKDTSAKPSESWD